MHRLSLTISLPDDGQDSEEMENVLRAKLQQPLHVAELVVQAQGLTDNALEMIVHKHARVEHALLVENALTSRGMAFLKQWSLLRHLDVSFNAIGSDGVCELAFLECLEFLNLTETGVDDRGIRMLCLGESRHKLTHLLAACNQIGSDGIQSIVRHMPQLQHLSIEDNPFCAQDFRAMVVGLPACRILRAAIPANVIRGDEPTRTWANELCYQGQQEHLITEAMLAEWICSNATQQETEEWKQRQQQADNEKEEFDASWAEHQRLLTE